MRIGVDEFEAGDVDAKSDVAAFGEGNVNFVQAVVSVRCMLDQVDV